MRRSSIIGPILLILIGGLFLLNNLRPDLPVLRLIGDYWPLLLIGWGGIRLIEITLWRISGKPLPSKGVSGGEWVLIAFLCMIGLSVFWAHRVQWPGRINMRGLDMFGESYDFNYPEKKSQAGKTPRVLIENLRGNARIVGADTYELKVTGRASVRAFSQGDADRAFRDCPFEMVRQGDLTVIRTNQERLSGPNRISADLELTVPRGASVEGRGRYGDFDVSGITGNITIDSDNAGVRASDLGGNLRVETRKSDIIRAANVKGNVEVKGGGWDLELDGIEGQSTINGSFTGSLTFRRLAKPLRFESSNTELRAERIPGRIAMSRGDLTGSDIVGPILVKARSKDIDLSDFTQALEVDVDRGDLEIRPARTPLAKMSLKTRAGHVNLSLPPAAKFEIKASTNKGDIGNEWGSPLVQRSEGRGQTLQGSVGQGPEITITTERGQITVSKGSETGAPPQAPKAPVAPKAPAVTTL